MKKKRVIVVTILIILVIAWILGIYKLSSMNTSNSNGKSSGIISVFIEDTLEVTNKYGITNSHPDDAKLEKASQLLNAPLRKVMHASVYFVLAFMIIFVTNFLFHNKKYVISAIITIVLILVAAGFDEYHQTFVDGRTGNVKDVLIDTAGGVAGILFYGTYYYVYSRGYKRGLKEKSVK
jgi:VanZ family protein